VGKFLYSHCTTAGCGCQALFLTNISGVVVLQYMGNSRKKGIQDSRCVAKWGLAKTINDTEEVLYERDYITAGAQAQANG
jgi:hypothetical protein